MKYKNIARAAWDDAFGENVELKHNVVAVEALGTELGFAGDSGYVGAGWYGRWGQAGRPRQEIP